MFEFIALLFVVLAIVTLVKAIVVVPQQSAYVVERLGKFHVALTAGPSILIPYVDRVAHKIPLQEIPMDTDPQTAITRDNVTVSVDGILYFQVTNPQQAAYGTSDFRTAIEMLAKTTLRSEVGKYELDRLLEERSAINTAVVTALDEASMAWGVKVLRYEVKDITPPESVLRAMQLQMTAEREKRALIARSEGQRAEQINLAEGEKQAAIAQSEGEKQAAINRAQGEAQSIVLVAQATSEALNRIGEALVKQGGMEAVNLKVAEKYVEAFGNIAKQGNTLVVPSNMSDMAGMISTAMHMVQKQKSN